MKTSVSIIGLIGTLVGGGFAVLGGLMALFVFLAGGDTTSKGVVGALGLYFLGKGIAVGGLGVLCSSQVLAVPNTPAPSIGTQRTV
jgi:hypothetical protein